MSFIVSELVFLYLLSGGIDRFPENVVVFLLFLTAGIGVARYLFSPPVALLTSCTSVVTTMITVNYLFGSSTKPLVFPFAQDPFGDLMSGVIGGALWFFLLAALHEFFTKRRRVSSRGAKFVLISASCSIVFILAFVFSKSIMIFFDEHPWFPTTIIGIVTFVVGFLIAEWRTRRTDKRTT